MKHFDINRWTDFARGLVTDADRAAMDAHLSSGCARCQATLGLVQQVVAAAGRAMASEPPADIVRWAKAISVVQKPLRSPRLRLIPRLLYNSLADPMPAGMRSEDTLSHQALYEAENFVIDLRLEHEKGCPVVTLLGQVSDRRDPGRAMPSAPILLMSRTNVVSRAVSNRFGEFQMEYAPAAHLRLRVPVDPDGRLIELPLELLQAQNLARSSQPRSVSLPRLSRRQEPTSAKRSTKKGK
jgi:hypothetical protein